jgi:hypothetical protein
MIKTLFGLIGLIITVFMIAHGFLWYEHGTPYPCEVAVLRVVDDTGDEADFAAAMAYKKQLADVFHREFGMLSCYRVAFHGPDAMIQTVTKELKERKKQATEHLEQKNEKSSK